MKPDELLTRLAAILPAGTVEVVAVPDEAVIRVDRAHVAQVLQTLRDHVELAFEQLTDLTAVDYLGQTPRFEVVYQLNSLSQNHRVRVKVGVPADDSSVPSAVPLWKAANWAEREVWDQFGIRFVGHPDLRRLLNEERFEGHPLRKDYPVDRRQVFVPERDPIARPWFPADRS